LRSGEAKVGLPAFTFETSSFCYSPLRRERVVAIRIPVTNLTVGSVNEHLTSLVLRDLTGDTNRVSLRGLERRCAAVACADDPPLSASRYHVLILTHVFT
jgi:hypothetical protein